MSTDFINGHYQWIFSGIGVAIVGGIVAFFRRQNKNQPDQNNKQNVSVTLNSVVNNQQPNSSSTSSLPDTRKNSTRILFIDDDTKFKIVTILKNAGWTNTSIVKDLKSLDLPDVQNTQIFFVDVNGVGKMLGFKDEGLGLAMALKEKYPQKKVVIYSSVQTGNRFHEALRKADYTLSKDAEPYQFQRVVETLCGEV